MTTARLHRFVILGIATIATLIASTAVYAFDPGTGAGESAQYEPSQVAEP